MPAAAAPAQAPVAHLLGWDCVEFWVGNARTFAGFLMAGFGFRCTAYAGPETGVRDKASYVLEQGDIRFVVTGALTADSPIAEHVRAHGDGVHDLAWLVDDAGAAFDAAVARGARVGRGPRGPRPTSTARCRWPRSAPTARPATPSSTARDYTGPLLEPGYDRREPAARPGRPRGRPRAASTTSSATSSRASSTTGCASTRDVHRLQPARALRRRPDRHRVLGAACRRSCGTAPRSCMPINEPADGPQEEPDPGVRRDLRRPRRAAHRPAHRRHRRHGRGAAGPRRAVHARARHVLRRGPGPPRRRRPAVGRPAAAQHPRRPRPRRAPAADLHRDRHRPARRCSSRSSSARAPRASARATSRRCSKPSSATRLAAATCDRA